MGFFSKDIETLDDLFVHTLRDISTPKSRSRKPCQMIDKATNPELKSGFDRPLLQTKEHVKRVEKVFEMHGTEAKGVDCPAIHRHP